MMQWFDGKPLFNDVRRSLQKTMGRLKGLTTLVRKGTETTKTKVRTRGTCDQSLGAERGRFEKGEKENADSR